MNKKGFTLIELLTVIIIIAIISTIAIKTITDRIDNSKQRAYDIQINNIKDAAKKYVLENNMEDKYHLNTICLTIPMFQEKGYLEKGNIKNPKTNENFDTSKTFIKVKFDLEKNQYKYDFTDVCSNTNIIPISDTIISNNNIKVSAKEDGLYETTDSYIYKGANPNNYIEINNVKYRIVSINKETMMIKVINLLDNQKQISQNGFIKDLNDDFETGTTYSQIKDYIALNTKWHSGIVSKLDTAQVIKSIEKQNNKFNTISLLTVGEYIDASLNKNCYSDNTCTSYLSTSKNYWLANNTSDNKTWYINDKNQLAYVTPSSQLYNVYPCFNLKLDTQIASGDGSSSNPYKLK